MKKNYQWIACLCLVIFIIAAFFLLEEKRKQKLQDGTFVLERTWNYDSLYQGRG